MTRKSINLFESDDSRAVSPVIGVILMVAITVILAAVIGTFVLGLGQDVSKTAPQASLSMQDSGGNLQISHEGGDSITNATVTIDGTEVNSSFSISVGETKTINTNGTYSGTSTVRVIDPESQQLIAKQTVNWK